MILCQKTYKNSDLKCEIKQCYRCKHTEQRISLYEGIEEGVKKYIGIILCLNDWCGLEIMSDRSFINEQEAIDDIVSIWNNRNER